MLPDDLKNRREDLFRAQRAAEDRAEEERAEHLLNNIMEMSQDEVDAIYGSVWPEEDSRQRAFGSVQIAIGLCHKEEREWPTQLKSACLDLSQMELGLDKTTRVIPQILLVDQDACRLQERRKLLSDLKVETKFAGTAANAVAILEDNKFHLVIVDYQPVTEGDRRDLLELQEFNLQVPVINVQAWAGFAYSDNRRLNRDLLRAVAQVLGKPIPRGLPRKRTASTAVVIGEQGELDIV